MRLGTALIFRLAVLQAVTDIRWAGTFKEIEPSRTVGRAVVLCCLAVSLLFVLLGNGIFRVRLPRHWHVVVAVITGRGTVRLTYLYASKTSAPALGTRRHETMDPAAQRAMWPISKFKQENVSDFAPTEAVTTAGGFTS